MDVHHGVVFQVGDLDGIFGSDGLDIFVKRTIGGGLGMAASEEVRDL
jgi:hypothetical protein